MPVFKSIAEANAALSTTFFESMLPYLPTGTLYLLLDEQSTPHSAWDSEWDAETVANLLGFSEFSIQPLRFVYIPARTNDEADSPTIVFINPLPEGVCDLTTVREKIIRRVKTFSDLPNRS